jgi:hypothetical protein
MTDQEFIDMLNAYFDSFVGPIRPARVSERVAPTCSSCGEEGPTWQRCGANL